MRSTKLLTTVILSSLIASLSIPVMAYQGDLGDEILQPNDGWAAFSTGTTGGSQAIPS